MADFEDVLKTGDQSVAGNGSQNVLTIHEIISTIVSGGGWTRFFYEWMKFQIF